MLGWTSSPSAGSYKYLETMLVCKVSPSLYFLKVRGVALAVTTGRQISKRSLKVSLDKNGVSTSISPLLGIGK